ncbi:MAG: hypothetical protein ACR2GY_10710 [Phycisphaerales bacterium]
MDAAIPQDLENWADVLSRLPIEGVLGAALVVLIGLLLWAFGRRILKAAIVTCGLALGAAIGWFGAAYAEGLPLPPWAIAAAFAVVLGFMAWLSYRPAMALFLAIVLAALCPLLVIAWSSIRGIEAFPQPAHMQDAGSDEVDTSRSLMEEIRELEERARNADNIVQEARDLLKERGRDAMGMNETDADADDDDATAEAAALPPWREQLDVVVSRARTLIRERWEAADPGIRRSILLSVACGAILGLLIGLVAPGFTASLVTATIGSAMLLFGGSVLTASLGGTSAELPWLPRSAIAWASVWLALSVIGIAIQWTFRPRSVDNQRKG